MKKVDVFFKVRLKCEVGEVSGRLRARIRFQTHNTHSDYLADIIYRYLWRELL